MTSDENSLGDVEQDQSSSSDQADQGSSYELPDGYRQILIDQEVEVCELGFVLAGEPILPGVVLDRLRANGVHVEDEEVELGDLTRWSVSCQLRFPDDDFLTSWLFSVVETPDPIPGITLPDDVQETLGRGAWTLQVNTYLIGDAMTGYHRQLRVGSWLADDCLYAYDSLAQHLTPAKKLKQVVGWPAPPSPTSMFTVHAVHDDEFVWMHTHGLRRFGSVDLEMIDLPLAEAEQFGPLLNAIATRFIEHGPTAPGEEVHAGYNLLCAWFPWQDAMNFMEVEGPGGADDRSHHDEPAGVLVAIDDEGDFTSMELHADTMDNNPVLFVSTRETQRMSAIARHELPGFLSLAEAHAGDENWHFIVKIGVTVDDAEDDEREHLWFTLHGIIDGNADLTLDSEPYRIERLVAGSRMQLPLRDLSDFRVRKGDRSYGPEYLVDLVNAEG